MRTDAPNTARLHIRMSMLIDIIEYVIQYAYEHDMVDLMEYIGGKLKEVREVDV